MKKKSLAAQCDRRGCAWTSPSMLAERDYFTRRPQARRDAPHPEQYVLAQCGQESPAAMRTGEENGAFVAFTVNDSRITR